MKTDGYSFIQFHTIKNNNANIDEDFIVHLCPELICNFIKRIIDLDLDTNNIEHYAKLLEVNAILEIKKELNYIRIYVDTNTVDEGEYDRNLIKVTIFDFLKNVADILDLYTKNYYTYFNRSDKEGKPIKNYFNKETSSSELEYNQSRMASKLFGDTYNHNS